LGFGQTLPVLRRLGLANFKTKLWLIVLLALAWRVGYVLVTKRDATVWGDSVAYHYGANLLATGKGFIDPPALPAVGRAVAECRPPAVVRHVPRGLVIGRAEERALAPARVVRVGRGDGRIDRAPRTAAGR